METNPEPTPYTMSGTCLAEWRQTMDFNKRMACQALGISRTSLAQYESGRRRDDGRHVAIPLAVALACSALSAGLEPFGKK